MKKLFLLFVLALLPLLASADAVEIDGIYYDLNTETKEAKVTTNPNKYSGEVTIPDKVTYESVDYSVTSIGRSAFSNCSGLTSVTIPNSVTSIGDYAFDVCRGLTTVTIPNSVTSIGSSAFGYCRSLTAVNISDIPSWLSINFEDNDANPLSNAHHLYLNGVEITDLIIPNGITNINNHAFTGCRGLISVTIPDGLTSIGTYAFYGCKSLTTVNIPNSITKIGNYAFDGCVNLESLKIPDHIIKRKIHVDKAGSLYTLLPFDERYVIEELTLTGEINGSDLAVIRAMAGKSHCIRTDNNISWDDFDDTDGKLSVLDMSGVKIVSGGYYLFLDAEETGDSEVYLAQDDVIPGGIFYGCKKLTSISVPNRLKNVGAVAFDGTSWYENQPDGLVYIGNVLYKYKGDMPENFHITIKEGTIGIANAAFNGRSTLSSIVIPESVKYIGIDQHVHIHGGDYFDVFLEGISNSNVFLGCTSLTSIDIPNSVTSISSYAFRNCSSLVSVNIPNSVTSIEIGAFEGTAWYNNQPDGLVYAGKVAYKYKGDMPENTSIIIEDGTVAIANYSFGFCRGLTSVTIPNSVTSIGSIAFCECSSLTSVNIPNSVTSIGSCAFCECSSLTSVNIPNSVTSIGNQAFYECSSLTSVNIPNSVTSIGNQAFYGCFGLTSVTVYINTPLKITNSTFSNRTNATLYVPAGCKAVYKAADYWKEFKEIVEISSPYNSRLTVTDSAICKGGKISYPVSMENEEDITAFQFDVEVPQGITLTDVQLGDRKSDSHTVDYSKQADGSYRVIAVSLQKAPFSGDEGELVCLMLSADKDIEGGDYSIGIKNIVLTTTSKEKIYPADVNSVLSVLNIKQGDADGDGFVDVADVVTMIDYILDSSTSDIVFLAADMNADGEIDIFDVMIAINIILNRDNSAGSRTRASDNMEEQAVVTATADGMMLGVNDASRFTAFQFDVEVADGMELTEARLNGNAGNHRLYFLKNGQNSYRVIAVSMDNRMLTGSGNDLIRLSFSKDGQVQISNIVFVTPQKSKVYFASGNSEVTSIGSIEYEQAEEIFDLSGRKIGIGRNRLPKGVYIINNKKVVIK